MLPVFGKTRPAAFALVRPIVMRDRIDGPDVSATTGAGIGCSCDMTHATDGALAGQAHERTGVPVGQPLAEEVSYVRKPRATPLLRGR